jgi:hypothetical protein
MKEELIAALSRTSRLPVPSSKTEGTTSTISVIINNQLPIAFYIYQYSSTAGMLPVVDSDNNPVLVAANATGDSAPTVSLQQGVWYVARTAFSGSCAGIFYLSDDSSTTLDVSASALPLPNAIGPYPTPTTVSPIPLDSPLILVGCAKLENGNVICREQYWARGADSYVLPPGTKRTVSTTLTTGIQKISSHQTDVSTALGFSASAGWGPISASISGSLSTNASTFQQLILSSETTQYESLELKNESDVGQLYLKWQLTDVVTILGPDPQTLGTAVTPGPKTLPLPPSTPGGFGPIAMMVTAQTPVLIDGPYDPKKLPVPPATSV